MLRATTPCTFWTSQRPKVLRTWCALPILTSKCASRHNSEHFSNILTPKSAPTLRCLVHFEFQACFAPQRRALFRHLLKVWSGNEEFLAFWLENALRATMACNFSSLISPDVSAPAALASLLFRPSIPTKHWRKHRVSRLFYLFAHLHLLSSDSFASLTDPLFFPFFSLTLPISSVYIVGSLTCKLPWNIFHIFPKSDQLPNDQVPKHHKWLVLRMGKMKTNRMHLHNELWGEQRHTCFRLLLDLVCKSPWATWSSLQQLCQIWFQMSPQPKKQRQVVPADSCACNIEGIQKGPLTPMYDRLHKDGHGMSHVSNNIFLLAELH